MQSDNMPADQEAPKGPPLRKRGPRIRSYKPHTKSGCRTCKIRRVKCDEGKPICNRCTSTGRVCDGYLYGSSEGSTFPRSNESLTPPDPSYRPLAPALPDHPVPSIRSMVPASPFANDREHRGFAFFQRYTCTRLGSIFRSNFWDQVVLQTCYHEPAVRHAVTALGSLHERFMHGKRNPRGEVEWPTYADQVTDTFALQEYNKALRLLTVAPDKKSGDVMLMACILFVYFESIQGDHSATVSHINSGIKIVAELHKQSRSQPKGTRSSSTTPYISVRELALLFIRLDGMDSEIRALNTFYQDESPPTESAQHTITDTQPLPPKFDSLEEARIALENIHINAPHPTSPPEKPTPTFLPELYALSAQSSTILKVRQYTKILEHFIRVNRYNLSKQDQRAIHELKLHIIITSMNVTASLAEALKDECVWYQWGIKCEEIMKHAEDVCRVPDHKEQQPASGLDDGIIWLLSFVAITCRDAVMGKRALELLRKTERTEGVWNSFIAADVVERVVQDRELLC